MLLTVLTPKLQSPWRGPYVVKSQLSPVVYRVRPASRSAEVPDVSVHLAHLKPYHSQSRPPTPDFNLLGEMFLGKPFLFQLYCLTTTLRLTSSRT